MSPAADERRVAAVVLLIGGVLTAGLAAWLVPWDPVPGGALTLPAPESVLSPADLTQARAYTEPARLISWASLGVSLLVAIVLGFSSFGRRLAGRVRGPWWLQVVVLAAAVQVIGRLLTLPFSIVNQQRRREFGLTGQDWSAWVLDVLLDQAVALVFTTLLLWVVIGCARRWHRAWPAVAGGIVALMVMGGSFAYPVVVEPLYNDFESLADGPLRSEILALAQAERVEVDDVLVADASRRTTTLNAYVSGFGQTRRVVLYDNVVEDLPPREILSIVAHELAHAHHDDVLVGSALGAAGGFAGVGLLALAVAMVRRGSGAMSRPEVVPLVVVLLAIGSLLGAPVESRISRQIETRADVDALRATRDPSAFIAMQTQLARESLNPLTGPAWSHWWFGTHPTTRERIAIAERIANR